MLPCTCSNSVLSLWDNFWYHYQWPTSWLTFLTMLLAQIYTLTPLLSSNPTFPFSNKEHKLHVCSSNFSCFCRMRTIFCQHLLIISEFQHHQTEDWKIFSPQIRSSTPVCYWPVPQLHFDPSDTPHLCFDHTFYPIFLWIRPKRFAHLTSVCFLCWIFFLCP